MLRRRLRRRRGHPVPESERVRESESQRAQEKSSTPVRTHARKREEESVRMADLKHDDSVLEATEAVEQLSEIMPQVNALTSGKELRLERCIIIVLGTVVVVSGHERTTNFHCKERIRRVEVQGFHESVHGLSRVLNAKLCLSVGDECFLSAWRLQLYLWSMSPVFVTQTQTWSIGRVFNKAKRQVTELESDSVSSNREARRAGS